MPLYDIRCDYSGKKFERFIKLQDFSAPIFCACGASARRVISTPMFSIDNTGYSCPVTDKWIGSKHQHAENLRQQGCRVLEPGETTASTKRREADDLALEKAIDNTVEKTIDSWDSDKREKLANELISGLDIAVERK